MSNQHIMPCAYCGNKKVFPDDFPSCIYAQCWDCWRAEQARIQAEPKTFNEWIEYLSKYIGVKILNYRLKVKKRKNSGKRGLK